MVFWEGLRLYEYDMTLFCFGDPIHTLIRVLKPQHKGLATMRKLHFDERRFRNTWWCRLVNSEGSQGMRCT